MTFVCEGNGQNTASISQNFPGVFLQDPPVSGGRNH